MNIISKCLAALALLLGPMAANSQSYTFTDLGTLGGLQSTAYGINNLGQVVGWSDDPDNVQTATVWNGTTPTALGTLGSGNTTAYAIGINNAGQIVGVIGDSNVQAILWNGATPTALDGFISGALAINTAGQIAGYMASVEAGFSAAIEWNGTTPTVLVSGYSCYCGASALNNVGQIVGSINDQPVLWNGTTPTNLNLGGADDAVAVGINDAGQIVGWGQFFENNTSLALLWNGTTPTILGTLGGAISEGLAINNPGQIVGYSAYAPPNYGLIATVWEGTTAIDLNTLVILPSGFVLKQATAINDSGQIVGYGTNSAGENHAFLLTPVTQIPTVTPLITGTLGANGWYVSPTTTLAWTVTGQPPPTTSGCGTVNVPQTKGTPYTCSATNTAGSATDTVTIKEDSVAPQVTIKVPLKGKTYALHAKVLSSYSCLDATSGVASCTGTVKDGTRINTETKGTKTFTVTGTDNAGNAKTTSVLYSVN